MADSIVHSTAPSGIPHNPVLFTRLAFLHLVLGILCVVTELIYFEIMSLVYLLFECVFITTGCLSFIAGKTQNLQISFATMIMTIIACPIALIITVSAYNKHTAPPAYNYVYACLGSIEFGVSLGHSVFFCLHSLCCCCQLASLSERQAASRTTTYTTVAQQHQFAYQPGQPMQVYPGSIMQPMAYQPGIQQSMTAYYPRQPMTYYPMAAPYPQNQSLVMPACSNTGQTRQVVVTMPPYKQEHAGGKQSPPPAYSELS